MLNTGTYTILKRYHSTGHLREVKRKVKNSDLLSDQLKRIPFLLILTVLDS